MVTKSIVTQYPKDDKLQGSTGDASLSNSLYGPLAQLVRAVDS